MYCIYVNYIIIMNDKNDNWKYTLMETFADNFLIVKRITSQDNNFKVMIKHAKAHLSIQI